MEFHEFWAISFGATESFVIGKPPLEQSALIYIAEDHDYFARNGLNVTIRDDYEGRWMINNNLTSEKTIPDFRDFIYTKGLEEIKPESVNIR